MSRPVTSTLRVVAAAIVAIVALPLLPTPAHASAYRYWSYWSWNGSTWAYSNQGPSGSVHDGQTIGWRFAVQEDSSNAHAPRASGTSLCSDGVTVIIDYGTTADEPPGEHPPYPSPRGFCANDSSSNTGYRATAEHASLRVRDDGLVCGIDNYPKQECAPVVSSASHSPSPEPASQPPTRTKAAPRHAHAVAPTTAAGVPLPTETAVPHATATGPNGQPLAPTTNATATPTATPTLVVSEQSPASSSTGGGGFPVALVAGIAIAAALGAVAIWRYRAGPR